MGNLTIIICSFNEDKTICEVVNACRLYNERSEIIVVEDGYEIASTIIKNSDLILKIAMTSIWKRFRL